MKKIEIHGRKTDDGFAIRFLNGNPPEQTDAYNIAMQVLRQGANVREDILYWDEDTWDDFVWD